MKINGSRIRMSNFQRLKIGGILAGVALFFIINRLIPDSNPPPDAMGGDNTVQFEQAFNKPLDKRKDIVTEQRNAAETVVVPSEQGIESEDNEKPQYKSDTLLDDDDYTNYLFKASEADLQDPFVNKHAYEFVLNNKYACDGNVFVVALIHSAPDKHGERQDIRSTWGSVRFYSGAVIVPLFLLAQSENGTVQQHVVKESLTFRDIIQGNFIDSYRNLTNKNVMGLHWVRKHCSHAKFVLKTDDDTMVDVYHLIRFLFQKSPDGNLPDFLYCSTFKNQGPRRTKDDKWYVSVEEYPYQKYPPYCEGFAYVMSADVTEKLYDVSKSVKKYWVDDVYVTGFLALKCGIYHRDLENGHGFNLMTSQHLSKHAQSSIFLLAKYNHLRKSWHKAWSDIQIIHKIGE